MRLKSMGSFSKLFFIFSSSLSFIIHIWVLKSPIHLPRTQLLLNVFTCKPYRYLRYRISKIQLLYLPNPILLFHSLFSKK